MTLQYHIFKADGTKQQISRNEYDRILDEQRRGDDPLRAGELLIMDEMVPVPPDWGNATFTGID